MLQGDSPEFNSSTWQPDDLRQHGTEPLEYLDKVAASVVIRLFWRLCHCRRADDGVR